MNSVNCLILVLEQLKAPSEEMVEMLQELSVFKKKLQTQVLNLVELARVDLNQRRTGTQQTITEQIDTSSLGDRVVNREVIQFMRSRNITFTLEV